MSCRDFITDEDISRITRLAKQVAISRGRSAQMVDDTVSDYLLAAVEIAESSSSRDEFQSRISAGIHTKAIDIFRRTNGKPGSFKRMLFTRSYSIDELRVDDAGRVDANRFSGKYLASSSSHPESFWHIATSLLSDTEGRVVLMRSQDGDDGEKIGRQFGKTRQWGNWVVRSCLGRIRKSFQDSCHYDDYGNLTNST